MSDVGIFLLLAAIWGTIGAVLWFVMGRRGHDRFGWLILGAFLGPFALALALLSARWDEEMARTTLAEGTSHGGPIDVLVGFDGSADARAAVQSVTALLGSRLGRLTLAIAVPYGTGATGTKQARIMLEAEATHLPASTRLEVVHGRPAPALLALASDDGYELIVVGTRGAGFSKSVFGSAALELAETATVPVMLLNPERAPAALGVDATRAS